MPLSKTTQDHDEIRRWAEKRGAIPAAVASTETDDQTGIIRLEFPRAPHANDSALEEISWDEWFEKFDANGLQFTYQEKTASGERSNFNKLTYPMSERGSAKSHGATAHASAKNSKSDSPKSTSHKSESKSMSKNPSGKSSSREPSHKASASQATSKTSGSHSSAKSSGRTGVPSGRGSSNRTTGRSSG